MRSRRDIYIMVGLFVALILFVVFGPGRNDPPNDSSIPSSYSSAPGGALLLYRWIDSMGYNEQRLEYREFELDDADDALFMLNPSQPVSRSETDQLLAWVERGGTLVIADSSLSFMTQATEVFNALDFDTAVYSTTAVIEQANPLQPALNQPATGPAAVNATRYLLPRRSDYTPLLGTRDALLMAGVKVGRGYVYISSTIYPFTNEGLRDPRNVALVLNTLRTVPRGGRVLFDEIHHGYIDPPSTPSVVLGSPWGWAMTYGVIVIALYLILSGRRFGQPIPFKEETATRSSAEYVENMADLFQRGGKRAFIQKHYYTTFKRRLAKPYAISPQLPDDEFIRELAYASDTDPATLQAMLTTLQQEPANETVLLNTVSAADQFATEFEARRK